jgi:Family of unknown function (DUF5923)
MISQEELAQDAHRVATSIRPLISLLITSNAFRLIISDILVTARDILADVAVDVAKVAAIVEVGAEQVEEAVRPTDTELATGKDREGGVGVPSLEDLANVGQSVQERAAEATNMAVEESEAKRKAIWDRLENESPDRIKDTVLERVSEVSGISSVIQIENLWSTDHRTSASKSTIHCCTRYHGHSLPEIS